MASVAETLLSNERQSYKTRFAKGKMFFIAEDKIIFHNQINGESLRLAYFLKQDMPCTKCLCMDLLWRGTFPASIVCRSIGFPL